MISFVDERAEQQEDALKRAFRRVLMHDDTSAWVGASYADCSQYDTPQAFVSKREMIQSLVVSVCVIIWQALGNLDRHWSCGFVVPVLVIRASCHN